LQVLGFQIGDSVGGVNVQGLTFYLDAISATGGVQNCATGTGTGNLSFEPVDGSAADISKWAVDGYPSTAGVGTLAISTAEHNGGTSSLAIPLTNLSADPGGAALNMRQIYYANPNVYCGQTITFHVFMPTGSDGVTFQAYAQYNAYAKTVGMGPSTVTTNAWNTYAFTVPSDVGPGGIQRIGLQIINKRGVPDGGTGDGGTGDGGADGGVVNGFTGTVYVDDITW
jgi:hypothetical protein